MNIIEKQSIVQTINLVMADLTKIGIGKNQEIKFGNSYKYRGIDDIHNALAPILVTHGLVILPEVIQQENKMGKSNKATNQEETHLTVKYTFTHIHNEQTLTTTIASEAFDSSDKSVAKALSMAYKYMAIQSFSIPVVGNEDGDAHRPEVSEEVSEKHSELKEEIKKLMKTCIKKSLIDWIIEHNGLNSEDEIFLNKLKDQLLANQHESEVA